MPRQAARLLCLAVIFGSLGAMPPAPALAGGPAAAYGPDTPEAGSVEAIAKFTTDPKFGNPWVAYVPASDSIPSPTKYLGHVAGAAGELSHVAQIQGYFRELAKTTPRVTVQVIGKSEEGRDIVLAAIADEEGIRQISSSTKAATAQLADPRDDLAGAGGSDHRIRAAHLLLQRRAALHRDGQPRDGHGARLPPGGLEPADDPAHPQERDRADQPRLRARRPRQGRRLVLPLPQGKDGLRDPAREVAALLGLLRLPRQQPRHAPAGAQADAGRAPDVLWTSTRPWSTTCTSRSRCSTPGTEPARTTRTSTRSR